MPTVFRDLALIKVAADAETRSQVMQLVDVFRARVVDVAPDSLIIEITGTEDKIDGLLEVLRPFGVLEMAPDRPRARCRAAADSARSETPTSSAATADRLIGRARSPIQSDVHARFESSDSSHVSRRTDDDQWPTIYYDRDADLGLIRAQQGRGHRLRIAGARACAEPARQRRRRARRPAGRAASRARRPRRTGSRSTRRPTARAWADVIMVLVPDTSQPAALRDSDRAEPDGRARC